VLPVARGERDGDQECDARQLECVERDKLCKLVPATLAHVRELGHKMYQNEDPACQPKIQLVGLLATQNRAKHRN
jgi:hypothetical protein